MRNLEVWSNRRKRGWITLANMMDVRHYKRGMAIRLDEGHVVRVKEVVHDSGAIIIHAPLWWRLWRWLVQLVADIVAVISHAFGQ